jgi:hypothetical protein
MDDPESTGPPQKRVTSQLDHRRRRNVTPLKATTTAAATATHRRGILRENFREDSDAVRQSV